MSMPIKEFKYNCKKRCIVKGCFRKDVYIPTHEFGTDSISDIERHNDSKTHLGTNRDLKAHIPCAIKGCTYSTSDLSNLQKHELTHAKEAELGAQSCSYEGCTYTTFDLSNLVKHELRHEKEAKLGRPSEKTASVKETKVNSFVDEVIKDNLHLYF
jgi:hypothetical protein